MKKEDILKQAQSEKNKEYENAISYKALSRAAIALSVICIIVFLTKVLVSDLKGMERVIPFYDILSIMSGYVSVTYFYIYKKLRETKYMLVSILSLTIFAASMYLFIVTL